MLKNSVSTHQSTGSHFFGTTTGIQSGSDAFYESRSFMTFLTIFRVTELLDSFKLVLEGKTGKEIPKPSRLEFSEKFLTSKLTRCRRQHLLAVE